jgi:hypothetical protein
MLQFWQEANNIAEQIMLEPVRKIIFTCHSEERHLHLLHTCPGTSSLCECQGVQVSDEESQNSNQSTL